MLTPLHNILNLFRQLIRRQKFFAHPTACIDNGAIIGAGTHIWHFTHIMPNAQIGEECTIGQNVFIAPHVKIGRGCKIQNNVSLFTGVTCEDNVFIGPCATFTNVVNPRANVNRKAEFKPTLIGEGASIGANATIVCGHSIGKYSLIGAGAVITHNVPDYAIMVGNPAKQKGRISRYGNKLSFNEQHIAHCPDTNETYMLENERVKIINIQKDL